LTNAPQSLEGIDAFGPLIAIALAAVGSGRAKFTNQIALLEEMLAICRAASMTSTVFAAIV
jgi:hypothetical protein